jgi:hypothetical protein
MHGAAASTELERKLCEFDFWLGEWDLSWEDGATAERGEGTNSVYHDFDRRVIVESFDGRPSLDLQGMSVSTYDVEAGCWKQTWVDNRGFHAHAVGELADGAMDLRFERVDDGRLALYRMRWSEITPDSLTWSYERSFDRGATWEPRWEIAYSRVL